MGKKLTLSSDETTAAIAEAKVGDVITSLIDPDVALTGIYKYVQMALVGAGTMLYANKRHSGEFFNFGG